jgi:hypothetical protein
MFDKLDLIKRNVSSLTAAKQSDIHLIGPKRMRQEFAAFASVTYGEIRWYNACCRMFRRQEVFDATLRTFLDNPHVTSIYLLCRPEERRFWESDVLPKLRQCEHGAKVHEPLWGPIRGTVSFVLGDVDGDGRNEALLTILDEPFATYSQQGPTVPRFVFRVYSQSELMVPLEDVIRNATSEFRSDADAGQTAS